MIKHTPLVQPFMRRKVSLGSSSIMNVVRYKVGPLSGLFDNALQRPCFFILLNRHQKLRLLLHDYNHEVGSITRRAVCPLGGGQNTFPVHGPPHGLPISVDYPKIDKPRATTVVRIKEDISPTSSYVKIIKSIIILSS